MKTNKEPVLNLYPSSCDYKVKYLSEDKGEFTYKKCVFCSKPLQINVDRYWREFDEQCKCFSYKSLHSGFRSYVMNDNFILCDAVFVINKKNNYIFKTKILNKFHTFLKLGIVYTTVECSPYSYCTSKEGYSKISYKSDIIFWNNHLSYWGERKIVIEGLYKLGLIFYHLDFKILDEIYNRAGENYNDKKYKFKPIFIFFEKFSFENNYKNNYMMKINHISLKYELT